MKTINQPLISPEDRTRKSTVFFTALSLAALMVSATVGGAAFMIYHEFSTMPGAAQAASARGLQTVALANFSDQAETAPMTRRVAAGSSDRSDYQYADNTVLPPAEARRVIAAWTSNPLLPRVPAPLAKADDIVASNAAGENDRPPLTDAGSHYIVSQQTGQVIGVDGSAGAAVEARRAATLPVAVAVQTPPPEVRVASAVQVRPAIPVNPDELDATATQYPGATDGSQYIPVRPAQPVATGRSFDAASYLANQDNVPVARAQAVNPTSRAMGYRQDFRLPDLGN